MRITKTLAALAAGAMALAACGSVTVSAGPDADSGYDTSKISTVREIADLVPERVKSDGKLTFGTNLYWPPAGFYASDGTSPIGYDVDLMKALAAVMGLKPDIQQAEFASIMPGIPQRYEMGVSAITITSDRQKNFTMIQYYTVGTAWAVGKGNPTHFNPKNICGKTIGVQSGTLQDDAIAKMAKACDNPPDIQRYDKQNAVTQVLIGGKVDAMAADTSVIQYALTQARGTLETIGDVTDSAPQGVVVGKGDAQMSKATQAALQYLMDKGILKGIFAKWGIKDNVASQALINPVK